MLEIQKPGVRLGHIPKMWPIRVFASKPESEIYAEAALKMICNKNLNAWDKALRSVRKYQETYLIASKILNEDR